MKSDGTIRLSVPYGITESYAMKFLLSKKGWVLQHKKVATTLQSQMLIGKSRRLQLIPAAIERIAIRIEQGSVTIRYPMHLSERDPLVQQKAKQAAEKAIKTEAAHLLPQRLKTIAKQYQLSHRDIDVKKLKSRWGSCDQRGNIVLNIYLVQLPWQLIDYVIIHELCHVIHHNHSDKFWSRVAQYTPNYKQLKKQLKSHPTDIFEGILSSSLTTN
jgi:hypothetical protein